MTWKLWSTSHSRDADKSGQRAFTDHNRIRIAMQATNSTRANRIERVDLLLLLSHVDHEHGLITTHIKRHLNARVQHGQRKITSQAKITENSAKWEVNHEGSPDLMTHGQ